MHNTLIYLLGKVYYNYQSPNLYDFFKIINYNPTKLNSTGLIFNLICTHKVMHFFIEDF